MKRPARRDSSGTAFRGGSRIRGVCTVHSPTGELSASASMRIRRRAQRATQPASSGSALTEVEAVDIVRGGRAAVR